MLCYKPYKKKEPHSQELFKKPTLFNKLNFLNLTKTNILMLANIAAIIASIILLIVSFISIFCLSFLMITITFFIIETSWKIHRLIHNFTNILPVYDKLFTILFIKALFKYIKFINASIQNLIKSAFNYIFYPSKNVASFKEIISKILLIYKVIILELLKIIFTPKKCNKIGLLFLGHKEILELIKK